jgi:hypothetical protein
METHDSGENTGRIANCSIESILDKPIDVNKPGIPSLYDAASAIATYLLLKAM